MDKPLLSFIIPTYNREDLVLDALDSVWSQCHRPIEVVVVDDGSTDRTWERIQDWAASRESDEFSMVLHRQPNRGASAARNHGLRATTGHYVAFLDSDDVLRSDFANVMKGVLEKHEFLDFVVCRNEPRFHEEPITKEVSIVQGRSRDCALKSEELTLISEENWLNEKWQTGCAVYRKDFLVQLGGWDEALRFGWQDRELCIRVLLLGGKGAAVPEALVYVRGGSHERLRRFAEEQDKRFFVGVSGAYFRLSRLALLEGKVRKAFPLLTRGVWFGLRASGLPQSWMDRTRALTKWIGARK